MQQHKDCNFSYAGLKTQVRLAIQSKNMYVERGQFGHFLVSHFIGMAEYMLILAAS